MLSGDALAADSELVGQLKGRTQDVSTALQEKVAPLHGAVGMVAPPALKDFLRALSTAREAHDGLLRDAESYFNDATFALGSVHRGLDRHEGEYSHAFSGLREV
ncbi:hypothetical protein HMPREF3166_04520 [Corynebacterium sp. HMSC08A12]|uniref:hypothetical protein n=1 Tax=Corynebacterium sp. HMSC08A12 TaxID=1581134 RepID=UPI0008A30812|nr:hypothetical protein [Corynebacterium sp. HMSC08A12]OFT35259.1 hypothetical protein HMPREF3166_04520 [Corynebacterium sp. HMSC08A12]